MIKMTIVMIGKHNREVVDPSKACVERKKRFHYSLRSKRIREKSSGRFNQLVSLRDASWSPLVMLDEVAE